MNTPLPEHTPEPLHDSYEGRPAAQTDPAAPPDFGPDRDASALRDASNLDTINSDALPPVAPAPAPPAPVLDRRTPFRWMDLLYLAMFYFLAGAIITLAVATVTLLAFHLSTAALQNSTSTKAVVLIVSQGILSVATIGFLYTLVRSRTGAPFWATVGWRKFHTMLSRTGASLGYIGSGFLLAFVVGWISRYVGEESSLPMEQLFRSRSSVILLMALGIVVAPVVEETIFRGCIYPVIARTFGVRTGIVSTGVLFGLAHAQQLWGGWAQIALIMCVGIFLTYVRARAGTVAASYFVHLGYNSILFAGFYFATGGLRYFPS